MIIKNPHLSIQTKKSRKRVMMMMTRTMILNLDKVGFRKLAKEVENRLLLPMHREPHHHDLKSLIRISNRPSSKTHLKKSPPLSSGLNNSKRSWNKREESTFSAKHLLMRRKPRFKSSEKLMLRNWPFWMSTEISRKPSLLPQLKLML